jgi:hypothetical protein
VIHGYEVEALKQNMVENEVNTQLKEPIKTKSISKERIIHHMARSIQLRLKLS